MHTLILGFDSFDPEIFEGLASQGKMPNLAKFVRSDQYSRFKVSDPPQTEVSWTSIATGLDPGGHGIFDFVHRDPSTYTPFVSLLPTEQKFGGTQFIPPYKAHTIFEETTNLGYPATSLWWPATFPAKLESPVHTIPGLGTPDILGRLGVGTLYTTDPDLSDEERKTAVKILEGSGNNRYSSTLEGPATKKRGAAQTVEIELKLELNDDSTANLVIGKNSIQLVIGEWSPIIDITFKMGLFFSVRAVTRVILTQTSPDLQLYFLPLQIHPLSSPWRYATPPSFVKNVWRTCGPYLSLGWPQDTTALEEGCISDDQFIELCNLIHADRERTLMHLLDTFNEGVLGVVFDSLDRVQHMFRRDRPDIVESWYNKLDGLVGRIEKRMQVAGYSDLKFIVLSDHGFSEFDYKVHLNRWLEENGFLSTTDSNASSGLGDVDWSKSQAYGVGLNSLYLNLGNREGRGSVPPDQVFPLLDKIQNGLKEWRGPDGRKVVARALNRDEAYSGPLRSYGPDLLIGYSPGYRASAETGLGKWRPSSIEPNNDHWGADHCIDSLAVPGVIFCNQGFREFSKPSYHDFPVLAINKQLETVGKTSPPPSTAGEDSEVLDKRLKDLGYL